MEDVQNVKSTFISIANELHILLEDPTLPQPVQGQLRELVLKLERKDDVSSSSEISDQILPEFTDHFHGNNTLTRLSQNTSPVLVMSTDPKCTLETPGVSGRCVNMITIGSKFLNPCTPSNIYKTHRSCNVSIMPDSQRLIPWRLRSRHDQRSHSRSSSISNYDDVQSTLPNYMPSPPSSPVRDPSPHSVTSSSPNIKPCTVIVPKLNLSRYNDSSLKIKTEPNSSSSSQTASCITIKSEEQLSSRNPGPNCPIEMDRPLPVLDSPNSSLDTTASVIDKGLPGSPPEPLIVDPSSSQLTSPPNLGEDVPSSPLGLSSPLLEDDPHLLLEDNVLSSPIDLPSPVMDIVVPLSSTMEDDTAFIELDGNMSDVSLDHGLSSSNLEGNEAYGLKMNVENRNETMEDQSESSRDDMDMEINTESFEDTPDNIISYVVYPDLQLMDEELQIESSVTDNENEDTSSHSVHMDRSNHGRRKKATPKRARTSTAESFHSLSTSPLEVPLSPSQLPDIIKCTACNCDIVWREQPIFNHEILAVLTCKGCHSKFHDGKFTTDEDGKEDYCTLCGDGGQLVVCDRCPKSLCQECIGNICGKGYLGKLINNEIPYWECWVCDPTPLTKQRRFFKYFYEAHKKRRKEKIKMKKDERTYKSKEFITSSDDLSSDYTDEDNQTITDLASNIGSPSILSTETKSENEDNAAKSDTHNKENENESDSLLHDERSSYANTDSDAQAKNSTFRNESDQPGNESDRSGNESDETVKSKNEVENESDTLIDVEGVSQDDDEKSGSESEKTRNESDGPKNDLSGSKIKFNKSRYESGGLKSKSRIGHKPEKSGNESVSNEVNIDSPFLLNHSSNTGKSRTKFVKGYSKSLSSKSLKRNSITDPTTKDNNVYKRNASHKLTQADKTNLKKEKLFSTLDSDSSDVSSSDVSLSDCSDIVLRTKKKRKVSVDKEKTTLSTPLMTKSKRSFLLNTCDYGKEAAQRFAINDSSSSDEFDTTTKSTPIQATPTSREGTSTGNKSNSPAGSITNSVTKSNKKQLSTNTKKRKLFEYSDNESNSEDDIINSVAKKDTPTTKKRNKVITLVTSSEEEEPIKEQLILSSPSPDRPQQDSIFCATKKSELDYSVRRRSSSSDSSDLDVLQRKPKRRRLLSPSSICSSSINGINSPANKLSEDSDNEFEGEGRGFYHRGVNIKRRKGRIRRGLLSSSSDDGGDNNETITIEDSDQEDKAVPATPATPGKRKNIRKLISKDKLAEETKVAQREEKERLERLKKKEQGGDGDSDERIILEQKPETKEVLLEVRRSLVPKIKPHQVKGIKFLYNCVCEDIQRLTTEPGSGAILAHCMGLGKTLQVVAILDALLEHSDLTNITRVLVLCPVNTLLNWSDEWNKWVSFVKRDYHVWVLNDKNNSQRCSKLERWFKTGGVIIMGYEMFRNLTLGAKVKQEKMKKLFEKYLLDPGADIIVCDEGHVLRQEKSNLSLMVNKVATRRRIVLTGTPLQNNLKEYYTMVSFVKPNLLGTSKEFFNRFSNPISNGQHADSRPVDVRLMKQRAHILFQLLSGCVDVRMDTMMDKWMYRRKDYRILAESLPPKYEYVVSVRMTPIQEQLIKRYLARNNGYHTAADLFSTFANLAKVWNHPWVLMLDQERKDQAKDRELLDDFIVDDDDVSSLEGFVVKDKESDDDEFKVRKKELFGSSSSRESSHSREVTNGEKVSSPTNWFEDLLPDECSTKLDLSGKLVFLMELLKETEKVGEKVLVFSQSLLILDLIEEFLQQPEYGDYIEGINYFRLDGSTRSNERSDQMKQFNKKTSDDIRVFLISTKAGSLGVNLIGANRVVVFDACWNPTHDLQSIFRSYRFGQTKPVFVYRLLAQGTMEEKIYDRQVTKQSLSLRVIDEKQINRHYTISQLQELFTFSPAPPPSDTPPDKPFELPESEDIIFCKILKKLQPQAIIKYHKHDSLLEHVFDEELSEEERKAAWESYNAQKEMESRTYNIGINMQQGGSLMENDPNIMIGQENRSITTPITNQARTQIQSTITTQVFQLIQHGINVADRVKTLLTLRNSLAVSVLDPHNIPVRQRYDTTCVLLSSKLQELYQYVPQIREVLSNTAVINSFSINDRLKLERLRNRFLQELKEVDEKSKVQTPVPSQLPPMIGQTTATIVTPSNRGQSGGGILPPNQR